MSEKYVFIIWNKALFCKKKILSDLKKSFHIENVFYIEWNRTSYPDNLKAFYGTKTTDIRKKMDYIGTGPFLVIVLRDEQPQYQMRKVYEGDIEINANIYDKKWLYRQWTAGNFRVHCSTDVAETSHDLTILLGSDYQNKLSCIEDGSILKIDTKGIEGFASMEDLRNNLNAFGNCILTYDENNTMVIIARCRIDVCSFIKADSLTENSYRIKTADGEYRILLFGEAEGDLPEGFYKYAIANEKIVQGFASIAEEYNRYLPDRCITSGAIKGFFAEYGFTLNFEKKNSYRMESRKNVFVQVKDWIRYYRAKVLTLFGE